MSRSIYRGPWRAEHADRFARDILPAYSPELNPIERVRKLARRRCLHNHYFARLDGVLHAVESQLALWTNPDNTLLRLCVIT
ncbi:MAG: transposase [Terriglobia bacterium]